MQPQTADSTWIRAANYHISLRYGSTIYTKKFL